MKYWTRIPTIDKPVVLTIGNFDGVHIGHQALLGRMRDLAAAQGYTPVVITFENHPLYLIDPVRAPRLLMDRDEKKAMLERAGAAHMIVLSFDAALASTQPETFIGGLMESMNIRHIVVGFNFRFGRNGAGDGRLLSIMGTSMGFAVTVMPPVIYEGEPVSSSRIRATLAAGDCPAAGDMLGRSYSLTGTVAQGHGIGRKLGFPTANIEPQPGMLIPGRGVYASGVRVGDQWYGAMTNIGLRPTARRDEQEMGIEAHLFGLNRMIYGQRVEIVFHRRIRDELFFDSWDALKRQLYADREKIESILGKENIYK